MYQRNPDFTTDLAVAKDPATDEQTLEKLLRKHHGEIEIAEAIARNPSCPLWQFFDFWRYMEPVAAKNPELTKHQTHPRWEENARRKPREKYSKWSDAINDRKPQIYRARYLMAQGDGSWQRYIMSLELIPDQLIRDYAASKSAPLRKVIASRKTAPEDLFAQLASDSAKTVRQAVAANPYAPSTIIAGLASDKDASVAKAARDNPACPHEAVQLARLAEAAQPKTVDAGSLSFRGLCQLAGNKDTAGTRLAELASHEEPCVRFLVGINPGTTTELLEQVAQDKAPWVRTAAAFNPNTPAATLTAMVDSDNVDIHVGLASNPNLPEAEQLKLAETASDRAALTLANMTNHSAVWEKLAEAVEPVKKAKDKTWRHFLAEALAARKTGKFGGLQRAAKSRYLFVARIAARSETCPDNLACHYAHYLFQDYSQNPKAALALLEGKAAVKPEPYAEWKLDQWLSGGEAPGHVTSYYIQSDEAKRRTQAVSGWTTEMIYLLLVVLDEDVNTRKRLARRDDLIRFVFEMLARDEKPGVREQIAKNKRTPKSVITAMNADGATIVRTAAAKRTPGPAKKAGNKGVANVGSATERARLARDTESAKILVDLAADRAASVRKAVAANRETPPETVAELARSDKEPKVRATAVQRLRDRDGLKAALSDPDKDVRIAAAVNTTWLQYCREDRATHYDQEFLSWIADADDEELRAVAARHTEDQTLHRKFMCDPSLQVQRELAWNRFMSGEDKLSFAQLSDDQDTASRLAYKTTDEELFITAAVKVTSHHADDPIRCHGQMMARPRVQDALCTHPLPSVRAAIAGQSKLTQRAQEVLAADKEEWVRERIARLEKA